MFMYRMGIEFLVGSGGWRLQNLCVCGLKKTTVPMFCVGGGVSGS